LQRLLTIVLVLGLLTATSVAFAVTEGLKLTKSPITRTRIIRAADVANLKAPALKTFSPTCGKGCPTAGAMLRFDLMEADRLTVDVMTPGRRSIRQLAAGRESARGYQHFLWNGLTDEGTPAPDGRYLFQVKLSRTHRTILLQNPLTLDTQAPKVEKAVGATAVISPDGDHRGDGLQISYRFSEPAHALLFVRGRRVVFVRAAHEVGSFVWPGTIHGVEPPPGTYYLRVGAQDPAGNVTGPAHGLVVAVRIRYIVLGKHAVRVKAGTLFGIRVDTDARAYDWTLGSASGVSSAPLLVVRAPTKPGSYRFVAQESRHRATELVRVVRRR
jgi:hypothetical protein